MFFHLPERVLCCTFFCPLQNTKTSFFRPVEIIFPYHGRGHCQKDMVVFPPHAVPQTNVRIAICLNLYYNEKKKENGVFYVDFTCMPVSRIRRHYLHSR